MKKISQLLFINIVLLFLISVKHSYSDVFQMEVSPIVKDHKLQLSVQDFSAADQEVFNHVGTLKADEINTRQVFSNATPLDLFNAIVQQDKNEVLRLLLLPEFQNFDINGTVAVAQQGDSVSEDSSGPALLVCLNHFSKDVFDLLVAYDADVNALVLDSGQSLLLYALQKSNVDAIKALIATKKLNKDSFLSVVLTPDSVFFKHLLSGDTVTRAVLGIIIDGVALQEQKISQQAVVQALLLNLAQQGHSALFKDIFESYAVEVNNGITKDASVIYSGTRLLDAVVKMSKTPEAKNFFEGSDQIIKFLLEKGAKLSESMLLEKSVQEYIETLKSSIFTGISACSASSDLVAQQTALFQLTALLDQVAGTSAQAVIVQHNQNNEDRNPLFSAVEKNSVDCAQLLLSYGADANASGGAHEDGQWTNVLEMAVHHNNLAMVELLTQKGGFKIDSFTVPRIRSLGDDYRAIADFLEKSFQSQKA